MSKAHKGTWQRLSETEYTGFCAAAQLVADQSWIPGEVGRKASAYYERLLELFTGLIEQSQKAGKVRTDGPAGELAREAPFVHLGVALMAMNLTEERGPSSFSRRRMSDWLRTLEPQRKRTQ